MSEPKYYFAPSKITIVKSLGQLGPAYCAEIGRVYHAFHYCVEKEDFFCVSTGIYKGNGVWLDESTGINVSASFNWADYLVKRKE